MSEFSVRKVLLWAILSLLVILGFWRLNEKNSEPLVLKGTELSKNSGDFLQSLSISSNTRVARLLCDENGTCNSAQEDSDAGLYWRLLAFATLVSFMRSR